MTARQASIGDRSTEVRERTCAVICGFVVVGVTIALFATEQTWWARGFAEASVLVLVLPLGVSLWMSARKQRADTARLRRTGRPAVALVLGRESAKDADGVESYRFLRLHISGDDVPAFEATIPDGPDPGPRLSVGERVPATVDPADNLFTVQNLPG